MERCTTQRLKVNGTGKKGRQKPEIISKERLYDYKCLNCDALIYSQAIKDFLDVLPDDKLACPFCMSLKVEEVTG